MGVAAEGTIATIGGGGGLQVAAPEYASYPALVSALPPGVPGRLASIPMIGGSGRTIMFDNGTAWVVMRGQMLVDQWVDFTSAGNTLVVVSTWSIPAGVFGDGHEMAGIVFARGLSGYASGTDNIRLRNEDQGAAGGLMGNITMTSSYPRASRGLAEVHRDGNSWLAADASVNPAYNNAIPNVRSHNWANPWVLGLTVQAGAAGHVMRINVKFGRL